MRCLLLLAVVGLAAACGGDGENVPVAGSAPVPSQGTGTATVAQINGGNYLDAFAVGAVALSRVLDAAHVLNIVADRPLQPDAPGANDCWASGALKWHDELPWWKHVTVDRSCRSGRVELRTGTFWRNEHGWDFESVGWRQLGSPVDQFLDSRGWISLERDSDGSVSVQGDLFVQMASGIAEYGDFSVTAMLTESGNADRVVDGSGEVRVDQFLPLRFRVLVSDAGAKLRVFAPDGSRVVVSDVSSGSSSARMFEVFRAGTSAAAITQTLAIDDPLLAAAMARASQ
jgi:hypothetical protein